MFRSKISSTFVILIAVLVGGVYLILHGGVSEGFEQDAEVAVRRAATIEEQSIRLDTFSLIEKAKATASDEKLYRRMLLNEDPELYDRLKSEYPDAASVKQVRHLAVNDDPLLVDKYRLEDVAEKIKGKRNVDLSLYDRRPAKPELFLVLDKTGRGVAALGNDKARWFGDDIAGDHPIVLEAVDDNQVKTAMWWWTWNETDEPTFFRVAIVPIRPDKTTSPAGVVVVGQRVGDGLATRSKRLMAGITSEGDDLETVDDQDLDAAPHVAYFSGNQIVASTFDGRRDDMLEEAALSSGKLLDNDRPEELLELDIGGQIFIGVSRFFTGEFKRDKASSGFVVLSSLTDAQQPVVEATDDVWLIGGVVLVVGLVALLYIVYSFLKPAERIEQGIGEVVAGNKDYEFEMSGDSSIFSSMAQGLNLMSAYLQGKPMPDDSDDLGGWGELIGGEDATQSSSSGPSQVTGVAMPGSIGGGSSQTDDADEDDPTS